MSEVKNYNYKSILNWVEKLRKKFGFIKNGKWEQKTQRVVKTIVCDDGFTWEKRVMKGTLRKGFARVLNFYIGCNLYGLPATHVVNLEKKTLVSWFIQ